MASIHYQFRYCIPFIRMTCGDPGLPVLVDLICHANNRNRCYPSYQHITDITLLSRASVAKAIQGLCDLSMIRIIDISERSLEEKAKDDRLNIYELSGYMKMGDLVIPYLNLDFDKLPVKITPLEGFEFEALVHDVNQYQFTTFTDMVHYVDSKKIYHYLKTPITDSFSSPLADELALPKPKRKKTGKTPPPPPRYPSLQYTDLDEKLPILRTRIGAFAMEAGGLTDDPTTRISKGMKSTPVYKFLEELLISTSHPDKGMMLGSVLSWLYLEERATPQQVIDFLRHYVNEVAIQGKGYDLPKPVDKWQGNWKRWLEGLVKVEPQSVTFEPDPACPKCGGLGRVRLPNPDRYSTEQLVRDCTCLKAVRRDQ